MHIIRLSRRGQPRLLKAAAKLDRDSAADAFMQRRAYMRLPSRPEKWRKIIIFRFPPYFSSSSHLGEPITRHRTNAYWNHFSAGESKRLVGNCRNGVCVCF